MKSIFAIFLVALFLAIQVGFSIATHYCGGEIFKQSIGFSQSELSCGMVMEVSSGCESDGETVKDNCCSDDFQSFVLIEDYNIQTEEISFSEQFTIAFALSFFDLMSINTPSYPKELNISPPLLERNIPVLFQSFLI